MIWLLISMASADPCPNPSDALQSAVFAFEDAEVAQAQAHIDSAMSGLECSQEPVENGSLQELFGFAAVVAYAAGDEAAARAAMERLQASSLSPTPHPYFGPELTEMFEEAGDAVPQSPVQLTIGDSWRRAWVDGELFSGGDSTSVRVGEHLIQAPTGDGWFADTLRVDDDAVFSADGSIASASPAVEMRPPPPDPVERRRRHRTGLLVAGALTAAAGGGALVYGWQAENRFKTDPYNAETYGGCALTESCYADARVDAIQTDASQIRIAYLAGYALTAVGVGIVGTELFILPAPRATGGQLGIRGAF